MGRACRQSLRCGGSEVAGWGGGEVGVRLQTWVAVGETCGLGRACRPDCGD